VCGAAWVEADQISDRIVTAVPDLTRQGQARRLSFVDQAKRGLEGTRLRQSMLPFDGDRRPSPVERVPDKGSLGAAMPITNLSGIALPAK
jgi:hypothetical protein